MKSNLAFLLLICFLFTGSCMNKGTGKNGTSESPDSNSVADTGFTGIKQYYSGTFLTYEVTFRNGVKEGLMKTYYPTGKLRQTFWYKNGMREDTAVWFHEDGAIFRKTPFSKDSMNGVQIQYYKSGKVRAKMNYVNGLRTDYLEEFNADGKKITDYPKVLIRTRDDYSLNGTFKVYVELDKKNVKANFYQGEFSDGLFNPKILKKINSSETTGFIQLNRSNAPSKDYTGVLAEILTGLGNRHLVYTRVNLPYNDLK